jgi:hypothetical protein
VPDNVEDLQKLPGVGRKTANVIASVVYNKPALAVDTHVFRVAARIGLTTNAKTPLAAEIQLMKFFLKNLFPKHITGLYCMAGMFALPVNQNVKNADLSVQYAGKITIKRRNSTRQKGKSSLASKDSLPLLPFRQSTRKCPSDVHHILRPKATVHRAK